MKTLLAVIALFSMSTMVGAADIRPPHCSNPLGDAAPACWVSNISWVVVDFRGDAAKPYKAEIERYIRLRLMNDLSPLDHETIPPDTAMRNARSADGTTGLHAVKELLGKGLVHCHIWTAGDKPVAVHVTCDLASMGMSTLPDAKFYRAQNLWRSDESRIRDVIKDLIRSNIEKISLEFMRDRQQFR
jgi:hypothetical protein